MSDIVVLGGGFAGLWSAAGAARLLRETGVDRSVTLVAPGDDLVIRPRLYQADPGKMRVPLDGVLGPIGVRREAATATGIDTERRRVTVTGRNGEVKELAYKRLVLATGSRLVRPDLPGAKHLHNVDTLDAAVTLEEHLHALPRRPPRPGRFTAVVVGAGFTGLEVATELVGRLRTIADEHGAVEKVRVVLVEQAAAVGPELGPSPRPVISEALDSLGVERHLGATLRSVNESGVVLSDGVELAARTVVWTAGTQASPLTGQIPAERDRLGRLVTDPFLRVPSVSGVFASGDTAAAEAEEPGRLVMQSCQHALQLGRFAGHNVAADLLGLPLVRFTPQPYVTCLDLGGAGAVTTDGWQRTVRTTGATAKQRKRTVNEKWIYPPVGDTAEILRQADYRLSTRQPVEVGPVQ